MIPDVDQNQVFLNPDGYLEARVIGDQTENTFQHMYDKAEPLIEQLKAEGKPMLGLVDMTEQTGYSLTSDKAALELLESITYDKLAMCKPPHSGVAEGIILAMGRGDSTKVFDSREEAIAWLLETDA